MKDLDRARIEAFIVAAGAKLDGDWLLVGGALVTLWLEPRRITEDIDFIGLGGTQRERLALMTLAEELGLPVEAVNSAADFFVFRVEGWREMLEVLHAGPTATIHRPSPTLFLLLKQARLSEQDLADCLATLGKVRQDGLHLEVPRLLAALDQSPPTSDAALAQRRASLRGALVAAG